MSFQLNPQFKDLEKPWVEKHDVKTTRASINEILRSGTPDWIKWPKDFKHYAQEQILAEQEQSYEMGRQYHLENQHLLTNRKARMVNAVNTKEFIKKLKQNGIKCFTVYNGMPQTVALWCIVPGTDRARYCAYCQTPNMYEWSILRLDKHGLPNGEAYRGWRTVLSQMVLKQIVTEKRIHEIFGAPVPNLISSVYRESLFDHRNGRRHIDPSNSDE